MSDAPAQTRDCLDPWELVFVRVDGTVALCCFAPHVGNLADAPLPEILDGAAARRVRETLLNGQLDDACRCCPARDWTTTTALAERVATHLATPLRESRDPSGRRLERRRGGGEFTSRIARLRAQLVPRVCGTRAYLAWRRAVAFFRFRRRESGPR